MAGTIFFGVPWDVVIFSLIMAAAASLIQTVRERNRQRAAGLPLTPFATVWPDTAAGMITGTGLALSVPMVWPVMGSFTGVALLAGVGGILGPKVWDLISTQGLAAGLRALAGSLSGPVGKIAEAFAAAAKGGSNDRTDVQGKSDTQADKTPGSQ